MPNGFEQFTNWNGAHNARFAFAASDLKAADFDRVYFGQIDLVTGTFTDGLAYSAPNFSRHLITRAGPGGVGSGVGNLSLIISSTGSGGGANLPAEMVYPQMVPEGTEYFLDFSSTGIRDVTGVTRSIAYNTGVVEFYGTMDYFEDFEANWPPATLGL